MSDAIAGSRYRRLPALVWIFLSVSALTPGGGMAMVPVFKRELVEKRHWLDESQMLDAIAVVQSLPGLLAVNLAVLMGYRVCGVVGALAAAFATIAAPFAMIVILAFAWTYIGTQPILENVFRGIRAGVSALILISVISIAKKSLNSVMSIIICISSFTACVLGVDITRVILIVFALGVGKMVVRR